MTASFAETVGNHGRSQKGGQPPQRREEMADNTISVKWDKAKKEFHGTLSHKWEPITRKPDDSRTFITPCKDIYVGATAKQAGQWGVHCMHLYSANGHYVPKVNRSEWTFVLPDSVRKHVPF